MTAAPTVWITRTRPGAEVTAERVRRIGMTPFVAPLLEVVFESGGDIDLSGIGALAFTSANGVRAFAARSTRRDLAVFTVGRGTAQAARDAGFQTVSAGESDVMSLAQAIPTGCAVLHPGAAEPAADLVAALAGRSLSARGIVVYRTVAATLSDEERAAAAACDLVLLQSARAARAFADLRLYGPSPVCLSTAIAAALGNDPAAPRVSTAAAPSEEALIAALLEAAG